MPTAKTKTKKINDILPKNIQLTFITVGAIALVVNAIQWIGLLIRVYPHGMHISQFSLLAFSSIILPVILFTLAFLIYDKKSSRFDRIFHSSLLTTAGLGILLVITTIEFLYMRYNSVAVDLFLPLIPALILLVVYIAALYALEYKSNQRTVYTSTAAIITLAFVTQAILGVSDLVMRHIGTKDIMNFLTHPTLVLNVVLPIAFFVTAYLTIRNVTAFNRTMTAFAYALVGALVVEIATTTYMIGLRLLASSDHEFASFHALNLQTFFVAMISVAIYAFLIITHNRSKKVAKKAK